MPSLTALPADSPRTNFRSRAVTALAVALLALALFQTGRMMAAMATTSITTDEYGTVLTFASRGPGHVATDYRAPKNHIFFNLLNSVLPGSDSLAPARARLLSILAAGLTAAAIIAYTARRRQLFEGSVVLALISFSPKFLELSMQARGYGFLALGGTLCAISAIEFLRGGSLRWLAVLAVSSALGAYTIPNFLFFSGPLLLLVWALAPRRATLLAGLLTGAAILLLYAPVATQFVQAFRDFQDDPEMDFEFVQGVFRSIQLYLFPSPDWAVFLFASALALAPFAMLQKKTAVPALRGCVAVTSAAIVFFAIVLFLRTPPVRVTAFVMIPFALSGSLALGRLARDARPAWLGVVALAAATFIVGSRAIAGTRNFSFVPAENWIDAGRLANALFPPGILIDSRRYAKYLKHWLRDPDARNAEFDEPAYLRSQLVVADAGNKWAEGRRFQPPGDPMRNAEIVIPGSTRDVVFYFHLPQEAKSFAESPRSLTDGLAATGVAAEGVRLRTRPLPGLHSVAILFNRTVSAGDVNFTIRDTATGEDLSAGVLVEGNVLVLPVGASRDTRAELEIELRAADPNLRALEAWTMQP